MQPAPVRFTAEDAHRAWEEWGANCGPGAIAGVLGLTPDEVRPHMGDFEEKHYTNPTLMWSALNSLGVSWNLGRPANNWPRYGLARVQWEGPWTAEGVSPRARYRYTHWVGACERGPGDLGIFDINAMASGGWISVSDWCVHLVPWLLKECVPRANGRWHLTHSVEISR